MKAILNVGGIFLSSKKKTQKFHGARSILFDFCNTYRNQDRGERGTSLQLSGRWFLRCITLLENFGVWAGQSESKSDKLVARQ